MTLYEVYTDTECPVCGSHNTKDHGPYEPHPLDACIAQPLDDRIHMMQCRSCFKWFDAASEPLATQGRNLNAALMASWQAGR